MTKFTSDTALSVMFHQYINPNILIIIIVTVSKTIKAEKIDNPVNKYVTIKTTRSDSVSDTKVSFQIVKYCS